MADPLWEQYAADAEERKRAVTEPFYDRALSDAILARMGPGFQHAYSANRKHFIKSPPLNLRGFYAPPDVGGETIDLPIVDPAGAMHRERVVPVPDHVYAIGPKPSAQILAHEFRHRAGIGSEYTNRVYDAMYSQDKDDWQNAVDLFRDYLMAHEESASEMTPDDAERKLLDILNTKESFFSIGARTELLRKEYENAPENDKPLLVEEPSIGGFLSEVFRTRENHWVNRVKLPYEKLNIQPKPMPQPKRK